MIPIDKCITEIEFRFPAVASNPATSEEWKTLKTIVLAQQTNNKHSMPCSCELTYVHNVKFLRVNESCAQHGSTA